MPGEEEPTEELEVYPEQERFGNISVRQKMGRTATPGSGKKSFVRKKNGETSSRETSVHAPAGHMSQHFTMPIYYKMKILKVSNISGMWTIVHMPHLEFGDSSESYLPWIGMPSYSNRASSTLNLIKCNPGILQPVN